MAVAAWPISLIEDVSSSQLENVFAPAVQEDLRQLIPDFFPVEFQTEASILCKFYAGVLQHARETLAFPLQKQLEFLELARTLVTTGHLQSIRGGGPQPAIDEVARFFQQELEKTSFSYTEAAQVTRYLVETYFKHFHLYQAVFSKGHTKKISYVELTVDEPLPIMPLSQAVQRLRMEEIMMLPQFADGRTFQRTISQDSSIGSKA